MTDTTIISKLARWIFEFDISAIPEKVLNLTKLTILDSIGCAIAARSDKEIQNILRVIDDLGGKEECTIIGTPKQTSVTNAVFANGALIRVLDLNDFIALDPSDGTMLGGHPSDCIAVALSVGEWKKSTGMDMIGITVMGYELIGRLQKLLNYTRLWDHVTAYGIVAPAMAARLMGLSQEKIAHAMAISAAHCATLGGLRSGQISAIKFLASPIVQQAGAFAALLAAHHLTGPLGIFEDECGFTRTVMHNQDPTVLTFPVENKYMIEGAGTKAFPCIFTGQTAVAAAVELRKSLVISPESVDKIELTMSDHPMILKQLADEGRRHPTSKETADHSFHFLVAVTLLDGELTHRQFENQRWFDPVVNTLMDRISVRTEKSLSERAPSSYPCSLRVLTRNKEERFVEMPYAPGHPHNRLGKSGMEEKFSRCVKDVLDDSHRDKVIQAVMELDSLPSTDVFFNQLIVP